MFSKHFFIILTVVFLSTAVRAQECTLSVQGNVFDATTELPLSFVNIYIRPLGQGEVTDDGGNFTRNGLCAGKYLLSVSRLGYKTRKVRIALERDTSLQIALSENQNLLREVVVAGKKVNPTTQPNLSVSRSSIEEGGNRNLSGLLENEAGVHLLKNGSGISKPVVQGLYGNRLTVLNNGIVQSGQQWGNDHSPEIDPFSADNITVIKGAGLIEYPGSGAGSAVLTEPARIRRDDGLQGQINYLFETNGLGHNLNVRLEEYSPALAWRVNGTLKKYGDRSTPDYFLNNTGAEEANLSFQAERAWNDEVFLEFYASTFNTRLGILRGAHVGNLTDLEEALTAEIPFFTDSTFSYAVDAPAQKVSHHLVKTKGKYLFAGRQSIEFALAGQMNDRREFDVRRSGREDIPALSLRQYTFTSDLKYSKKFGGNHTLKVGNQNTVTDNTNDPETGILPLIPDYLAWESGVFARVDRQAGRLRISFGLRYDFIRQIVQTISNGIPREVVRFDNYFHNINALSGLQFDLSATQKIQINSGYITRNPAINELYSGGLHQGVSGIEEGDTNLEAERAWKNSLEYDFSPTERFSLNLLLYHQNFRDYIYLSPQDEVRLTIRGAFPVFRYEQTDATIYGADVSIRFSFAEHFSGQVKYSYLRGTDRENDRPLVFMPPGSGYAELAFRMPQPVHIFSDLHAHDLTLEINNRLVFRQDNLRADQDFAPPPPAYNLLGAKAAADLVFSGQTLHFFVKGENILNVRYRDYLNRQRYFADEAGVSVVFGVNYKF